MIDDTSERMSLIEMDPLPGQACKRCGAKVALNADLICRGCHGYEISSMTKRELNEAPRAELDAIAAESRANAFVPSIGSFAGGQMQIVGFATAQGYIDAIARGVPPHTHAEYIRILRDRFEFGELTLRDLPGPMAQTELPNGAGVTHAPEGHRDGSAGIFDRPREQRAFVVGPAREEQAAQIPRSIDAKELVAGAVAEGHHAIVAWEGSTSITRGALVQALEAIGRLEWAPKAATAHAQAGAAIAVCQTNGLVVRALRKTRMVGSELKTGEHVWTVGRVDHQSQVGAEYGTVVCRFTLSGDALSYVGDAKVGDPVVAAFGARMASEVYKTSDITTWLGRILRWRLDSVRFGALGWLVPARHAELARKLCEAVASTGFGAGWVFGLPVATSDQLRDGIVRGLRDEVRDLVDRLDVERRAAADARTAWLGHGNNGLSSKAPAGDIGAGRAETYLRDFRKVAERVVAYSAVLGAERVESLRRTVRDAMAALEGIAGDDYSGIRARFAGIWDEIERDRAKHGGVL